MLGDTTRRRFLTVTGTGVAAAIAGCSGGEQAGTTAGDGSGETTTEVAGTDTESDSAGSETATSTGGTLRLGSAGKITSLDPVIKGTGGVNQWAESLLGYDNGKLPPEPRLAEDFEISNQGRTYRFKLKEGVRFHDGSELTASDVVYSWERLAQSPKTQNNDDIIGGTFTVDHEKDKSKNNPDEAEFADYVPGSLAVRAPEKYVFEFDVRTAFHATLAQIASESSFVVYPENTVGDIEREDVETDGKYSYQEAFGTENGGPKVAGTGPFQVDTWSRGDQLLLTRFEDYHGTVANVDAVDIAILGGEDAVYQRALNGNLDIFPVPAAKFDPARRSELEDIGNGRLVGTYTLRNGREVNTAQVNELGTDFILFNCDRVPKPVRQAFAMALNQHDIAENVYKDQQPAYTLIPPEIYPKSLGDFETRPEAHEAHYTEGAMSQTPWGANGYIHGINESRIEEARQHVRETGHEGEEYTFTAAKEPVWQTIATRLQQKGEAIGITVNVEIADYGTIISKGVFDRVLDFYSIGDTAEWPESDNILRFNPPQVANNQATQWGRKTEDGEWATEEQRVTARAWEENYLPHRGPGQENQRQRDKAYLTIEESNWEVVFDIPTAHRVNREYWSQDIEYTPPGVMGDKTYNEVTIDRN